MSNLVEDSRLPAGDYWVGDLCYVLSDDCWKEVCDLSDGTSGPATRAVTVAKTFREFYNLSCDKKKKLPIVSFGRKKKSAKKSNKKKAS